MRFRDRRDAGRRLGARLQGLAPVAPVVLALPRGGVPVGVEVAAALRAEFDVIVARKIGAPGHEELGLGAVAEGAPSPVLSVAGARLGVPPDALAGLAEAAWLEVDRQVQRYRAGRALPELTGRHVIVVDDGIATGATAEAALRSVRARSPRQLTLAAPVAAPDAVAALEAVADDVVRLLEPEQFSAVGEWYEDFAPTSDDEVLAILHASGAPGAPRG